MLPHNICSGHRDASKTNMFIKRRRLDGAVDSLGEISDTRISTMSPRIDDDLPQSTTATNAAPDTLATANSLGDVTTTATGTTITEASVTTTIPAADAESSVDLSITNATATDSDDSSNSTEGLINVSDRVAAGITIGAIVGVFVLAAAIFAFWRHHSNRARHVATNFHHHHRNSSNNNTDKDDDEKALRTRLPPSGGDDDDEEKGRPLHTITPTTPQHQQLHLRIIELPANEIAEVNGRSRKMVELGGRHLQQQQQHHSQQLYSSDLRGWDWHHHWYGSHNLRPYAARELWAGDVGHEMHVPPERERTKSLPTELSAVLYLPDDGDSRRRRGDMGVTVRVHGRPLTLRRTRTTAVMERRGGRIIDDDQELISSLMIGDLSLVSPTMSLSPQDKETVLGEEVSPTGSTMMAAEELVSPLSPHPQSPAVGWISF